jgi:hypothetical protein
MKEHSMLEVFTHKLGVLCEPQCDLNDLVGCFHDARMLIRVC